MNPIIRTGCKAGNEGKGETRKGQHDAMIVVSREVPDEQSKKGKPVVWRTK